MLSPADMLIIGAVALIAFGPDQLPKVARKAGQAIRDVQNTSQSFIREMERAADEEPAPRSSQTARGPSRPGAIYEDPRADHEVPNPSVPDHDVPNLDVPNHDVPDRSAPEVNIPHDASKGDATLPKS